ncbi:MAG: hypothetical protein C4524_13190 [Candidatus Zixiibacteriota bacterium]|nr:MAG: hypothetical protein C4524_13190 [candidate division Zixibacteria bacterium]
MSPAFDDPSRNGAPVDLEGLVAALAHEIRNPLTGISINVQYLQMIEPQDETRREIYADILEAVNRLDLLVREFTEYLQPAPLKPEKSDLNVLLSQALAGLEARGLARGLRVATQLDASLPEVEVDARQFRRALEGILEHCLRSAGEGGDVRLESRLQDQAAVVEVSRSGPALSASRLEALFEPAAALKSPETGFGMALVRQILAAHCCRLEVDSRHGGRTRLVVTFPLHVKSIS